MNELFETPFKRTCQNCRHYYIEVARKGNVIADGCRLETEIPFFDRDAYIGSTQTDCCNKWEGFDGRTE